MNDTRAVDGPAGLPEGERVGIAETSDDGIHACSELPEEAMPPSIGRSRVVMELGRGSYGRVFLGRDDDLDRAVAIKIPNPERISTQVEIDSYLAEARILARLDHPNIVPVYDVGRSDDGLYYIISKYIDDIDRAFKATGNRVPYVETADLVAKIALALHHAHTRGLVHRDIKPANILLDSTGQPCVADFGIALRDEDYGKGAKRIGTPSYMSPEQARGEGHRVDGRSDIFSLGVVFYELLSGQRPFRGESATEVMDQIVSAETRPLRQLHDRLPRELDRICLKALSKRASERYSTASDMAEDLLAFVATEKESQVRGPAIGSNVGLVGSGSGSGSGQGGHVIQSNTASALVSQASIERGALVGPWEGPLKVVPQGLRSFDACDADFFIELLPGPRDRDGLPDGLRFWKTRIESIDPDGTFKVGLIYGPSGCGKSSLVKAGLIPRLAAHIVPAYIEATPEGTEIRLLRSLHKVCPRLSAAADLLDALAELRRGRMLPPGQKLVIILDQFEQWLFAKGNETSRDLVAALRQCDGEHLQAIVMVRDDFWLAVSRFMRDLEIDLVPDQNIALVDLFDLQHARKVLRAFGRAYGKWPEREREESKDQGAFLDQAVGGLSQDGKVISVRLSLLSDMIKGKTWTTATLREVGGTEGVGVTFLEETFVSPTANPLHRTHIKAVRAVLKALLPPSGTDIKGQMRPESELRDVSGYASRPRDFEELIHVLDRDLRLITPTESERPAEEVRANQPEPERFYQLTHDYLVHSLKEWLTRKQRETARGRAELRLGELASLWTARPETRHLPSPSDWVRIRLWTRRRDWTDTQRRMMSRAGRMYGVTLLIGAGLISVTAWGGIVGYATLRATAIVESIATAETNDVPRLVSQLAGYRRWANPRLARLARENADDTKAHLNASLALLPVDGSQLDYLYGRLIKADPAESRVIRNALERFYPSLAATLWALLEDPKADPA